MDPPRKPSHDPTSRTHARSAARAGDRLPPSRRAAESVPGPAPQELIETTAKELLAALDADRALAKKDPARVRKLVDEILLPHFDTDYSARLVLGKHWRNATPEQQKRFIDAFYKSLLKNYGSALAEFTGDRLKVLPFRGDLASGQAIVRTEVKRSNGQRVPVNYTLRSTPAGWKAWDVTIEGISYVRNFRNDVGAEVDQTGLDAVIARLEKENQDGAAAARALTARRRRGALAAAGPGRFELSGDVGFADAARLLASGDAAFAGLERVEVDLARVARVDSAGLALLLEWSLAARAAGRGFAT